MERLGRVICFPSLAGWTRKRKTGFIEIVSAVHAVAGKLNGVGLNGALFSTIDLLA